MAEALVMLGVEAVPDGVRLCAAEFVVLDGTIWNGEFLAGVAQIDEIGAGARARLDAVHYPARHPFSVSSERWHATRGIQVCSSS